MSESECAAADEDGYAEADQDDREEHVFPSLEHLGDRPAGGDIPGEKDQHADEQQEHDAEDDHGCRADVQEHRDVDADVVSAVGEGDRGDSQDADLLALDLLVVVVTVGVVISGVVTFGTVLSPPNRPLKKPPPSVVCAALDSALNFAESTAASFGLSFVAHSGYGHPTRSAASLISRFFSSPPMLTSGIILST